MHLWLITPCECLIWKRHESTCCPLSLLNVFPWTYFSHVFNIFSCRRTKQKRIKTSITAQIGNCFICCLCSVLHKCSATDTIQYVCIALLTDTLQHTTMKVQCQLWLKIISVYKSQPESTAPTCPELSCLISSFTQLTHPHSKKVKWSNSLLLF